MRKVCVALENKNKYKDYFYLRIIILNYKSLNYCEKFENIVDYYFMSNYQFQISCNNYIK